jgi:hypothetical protein
MLQFWDVRNRRPQRWTLVFFPLLTVILFALIYIYGLIKANMKEAQPQPQPKAEKFMY